MVQCGNPMSFVTRFTELGFNLLQTFSSYAFGCLTHAPLWWVEASQPDGTQTEGQPMTTAAELRRVVFHHNWNDLDEWVRAVDDLADLTDDEIDCLVSQPEQQTLASVPH